MPRAVSVPAILINVVNPTFSISRISGAMLAANASTRVAPVSA